MKMNKILDNISIVLLLFSLVACNKEDAGSRDLLAYIKSDGAPVHNATIVFTRTPNSAVGQNSARFTLYLTREATQDVSVSVSPDPTLIEQYNLENKTSYKLLPDANYQLTGIEGLTVKAGELTAKDSIHITLKNRTELTNSTGYILPLSIQKVSSKEKGIMASVTHRTIYIIVSSSFNNIDQSTDKPVAGSFIDRNNPAWTILSASDSYSDFYATNVLDGDYDTDYIAYYDADNNITIDMKRVSSVKGFVLSPSYSFFTPMASQTIDVLTSLDNVTWTEQGKYTKATIDDSSSSANPDNRNINFYSPVQVRYVKFIFDKDLNYNFQGFSEINAIQ
ncbi:BT_3987 domain-containing protein [Sphingobacterium spiritivorum]|uniref:BT_3987 domain-containing protein n=1 Tax=Sphingobacterium spiritivorum TaxID=258 RepID=UPI003DA2FB64